MKGLTFGLDPSLTLILKPYPSKRLLELEGAARTPHFPKMSSRLWSPRCSVRQNKHRLWARLPAFRTQCGWKWAVIVARPTTTGKFTPERPSNLRRKAWCNGSATRTEHDLSPRPLRSVRAQSGLGTAGGCLRWEEATEEEGGVHKPDLHPRTRVKKSYRLSTSLKMTTLKNDATEGKL